MERQSQIVKWGNRRFRLGLALILLGFAAAGMGIAAAKLVPARCVSYYPALGFVAMVILFIAGVATIGASGETFDKEK
jgi:nitrate reductase gamma subunit